MNISQGKSDENRWWVATRAIILFSLFTFIAFLFDQGHKSQKPQDSNPSRSGIPEQKLPIQSEKGILPIPLVLYNTRRRKAARPNLGRGDTVKFYFK